MPLLGDKVMETRASGATKNPSHPASSANMATNMSRRNNLVLLRLSCIVVLGSPGFFAGACLPYFIAMPKLIADMVGWMFRLGPPESHQEACGWERSLGRLVNSCQTE